MSILQKQPSLTVCWLFSNLSILSGYGLLRIDRFRAAAYYPQPKVDWMINTDFSIDVVGPNAVTEEPLLFQ